MSLEWKPVKKSLKMAIHVVYVAPQHQGSYTLILFYIQHLAIHLKEISQIPCIHCVVAQSSSYALAQMNQCLILLVFRPADCRITQGP